MAFNFVQSTSVNICRGISCDDIDWCLYKYRHLIENVFARLKHFRAIATRYDKLKRNFEGSMALACAFLWLPM
jgi:hypothetical protein